MRWWERFCQPKQGNGFFLNAPQQSQIESSNASEAPMQLSDDASTNKEVISPILIYNTTNQLCQEHPSNLPSLASPNRDSTAVTSTWIRRNSNETFLCPWPEIPDNATAHARSYLAIWPPNTQRKCMAEIKQNKIEQVLAYRAQVPRFGRVLDSFFGYSD